MRNLSPSRQFVEVPGDRYTRRCVMRNYAFAACIFAILAGCGKNRGTIPAPTEGPGEVLSKPAPSAPAGDSVSFAEISLVIKHDGQLVKNQPVELTYGEIGTVGRTDGQGRISFSCTPGNHKVRVWEDETLIGTWEIVARAGHRSSIELVTGKEAVVESTEKLPPRPPPTAIPDSVKSASSPGSGG